MLVTKTESKTYKYTLDHLTDNEVSLIMVALRDTANRATSPLKTATEMRQLADDILKVVMS